MRMPSKASGVLANVVLWLPPQRGVVCGESTDRNTSSLFHTETSFCGPGQRTSASSCGLDGLEMSMMRKPP
jgi:hypothetical protein